jgi:hypothetical protein
MRRRSALLALLASPAPGLVRASQNLDAARLAAADWLRLLDAADSAASWAQAASTFKAAVTRAQWAQASTAMRSPLGSVKARAEQSALPTRALPGAPDGEYVVLQFKAEFEHKRAATETVTVVLEADGAWRVTGYFIR